MEDDRAAPGEQRERQQIGHLPEQENEPVGERFPDATAVPAEVEDQAEEHPGRHQPEPDRVELRLLELGQTRPLCQYRAEQSGAVPFAARALLGHR
jgi:hypothetical protein